MGLNAWMKGALISLAQEVWVKVFQNAKRIRLASLVNNINFNLIAAAEKDLWKHQPIGRQQVTTGSDSRAGASHGNIICMQGVLPVSHNALDQIMYVIFAPLFQWFCVVLWNRHITWLEM